MQKNTSVKEHQKEYHYLSYSGDIFSETIVFKEQAGTFFIFVAEDQNEKEFFYEGFGFKIPFVLRTDKLENFEKALISNDLNLGVLLGRAVVSKKIKIVEKVFN